MMDYVYGYDEIVSNFVAQLIPTVRERGFGKCKAIGVVKNGTLIAGFVYHTYDPDAGTIQISGAVLPGQKNWCSQKTLAHIYRYPFLQLGCQMIFQVIPASNERLPRQLAALNYTFVRIPRMLGRNEDAVLGLLTREDWEANKICKRFKHHIPDQQFSEAA